MVISFLAVSLLIAPTGVGEGAGCPPILRAEVIEMVQRLEVGELEAGSPSLLPPSWGTLYELTKLDDGTWEVHQGMSQATAPRSPNGPT